MKKIFWLIYKTVFLDFFYRIYFHGSKINIPVTTEDLPKIKKNLPTIFYGNHICWFDFMFLMKALRLKKTDFKLVATKMNQIIFPGLAASVIPVASRRLIAGWGGRSLKAIADSSIEQISSAEANQMNRQVISLAVATLQENKKLIIFPDGGLGRGWKNGLGFIIEEYFKNNPQRKLYLQPVYFSGVREADLMKKNFLKLLGFDHQLTSQIKFGQEIILQKEKREAREIVADLQESYFE